MAIETSIPPLDLREQLARIDQMLADHDRKRQEIKMAPWQVAVTVMGAGTAMFTAGAAFFALLLKWVA